ncbi:MAG: hypothetical protein JKY50_17165 [Oleispira sp.]|nr:hypothetical protein [Oleispira sp.]MBL4882484.1 hypothetical protein [Oleispira sp.]
MKHSKATLKLNINVRKANDLAINNIECLQKIDYSADWSNFPNSLKIICFLERLVPSSSQMEAEEEAKLIKMIQQCFLKQGIKFRDIRKNITLNINSQH